MAKKIMAACVAAFFMSVVNVVLTSCGQDYEQVVTELAAPQTITNTVKEYVPVNVTKYVNNYSWFTNQCLYVNGYEAMNYDVLNKYAAIEMAEAEQHMPAETKDTNSPWHWDDSQVSTAEVNTYGNDSLSVEAWIAPLYEKWEPVRLHPKVLKINAFYQMRGWFNLSNRGVVEFTQELNKPWYQVDSSVRVDTVKVTEKETELKFVEIHDTTVVKEIINNTDTVYVEVPVEKEILREVFVQGEEINTNVSNNIGYSTLTLWLGSKCLLDLTISHRDNPEKVKTYGTSLTSNATAEAWDWSSGQHTTAKYTTDGCTVSGITALVKQLSEKEIENVANMVTSPFVVEGYYANGANETKTFAITVAPMWGQVKEAEPEPVIVTPDVVEYRGIIRSISVDGSKLGTRPILQKRINSGNWEDVTKFKRVVIGLSGEPAGLDLYVSSTSVVEEHQDSWWYTGTDETWIGGKPNAEGVIVDRETKVYEFDWRFKADATNGGLIGPKTQLYVMRAHTVQVPDPDGNMHICTWEDGEEFSLSTNVKLNDTKHINDPAYTGQTKEMSGKLYKYAESFVQYFTASVGGKELVNTESRSQLWLPAE